MKEKRFAVRLSDAQVARLEELARQTGTSASSVVRQLIEHAEVRRVVAPRSPLEEDSRSERVVA